MAVLVDSSVWIAAANPRNAECSLLRRMILQNELIHAVRPIQVEVCQGAKTEAEFHKLWNAFLGFDFLEITDKHWGLSAWNYYKCRKKGITLSTLDCLIATMGKEHGVPVWSLDKSFHQIAPVIGVEEFTYLKPNSA